MEIYSIHFWNQLWESWNLRMVILLSFLLQVFLTVFAPLRKVTAKASLILPLWLAYMLLDTTAIFAAGLMSRGQNKTLGPFANPDLVAFWAPFILVYLGGPDTITSFSLENNDLWLRHLLGLSYQCWAVAYVFFQSFPNNRLWLPTLLIFFAGLIKYTERTRSYYLASSRKLRETLLTDSDPGHDYAKLMDEYSSQNEASLPTSVNITENERNREALTDLQVLRQAYGFFQTFKGLIADQIFSFRERSNSRDFFLSRTPRDAFKVVEVELNFFYESLYTKIAVVQGMLGYLLRLLTFGLYWVALVLFLVDKQKQRYKTIDVGITYTLLLGAISLDVIAYIMILNSDWTVVALTNSNHPSSITKVLQKLVNVHRKRWHGDTVIAGIVRRRWSESLSQFNLIYYCCHLRSNRWENVIGFLGLTNMLNDVRYVFQVKFSNVLRDFIFEELKIKSLEANALETAKVIHSARGDWVLRFEGCNNLLPWINEVDFNESLLLWHIATELCFNTEKVSTGTSTEGNNSENNEYYRDIAKLLSDYMLYLLIVQSTMMSTVAGIGQIRFRDTCDEAKELFRTRNLGRVDAAKKSSMDFFLCSDQETGPDKLHIQACESILGIDTTVKPVVDKGHKSRSVLFDACRLAKEMQELGEERKWVIMSKVWVEMLSYAACRCRAYTHAAQPSRGGQLITLVWLLMTHLGLGDQFAWA